VPTRLHYGNAAKGTEISWGYTVSPNARGKTLEWFKLLLLNENDLPDDIRGSPIIQQARQALKDANKTAVQVIADYLRELWVFCSQRITSAAGAAIWTKNRIQVVMTIPAIWKADAKSKMREAATRAGILGRPGTVLDFVTEPEAAALATLTDMEGRSSLDVEDSFVVVGCGGGTVDISKQAPATGIISVKAASL
jgi:molecular chaperone DnaK (HSP70)